MNEDVSCPAVQLRDACIIKTQMFWKSNLASSKQTFWHSNLAFQSCIPILHHQNRRFGIKTQMFWNSRYFVQRGHVYVSNVSNDSLYGNNGRDDEYGKLES